MSDVQVVLLTLGMALVSLTLLGWKVFACLQAVTGSGLRSREREQHAWMASQERLLERFRATTEQAPYLHQVHAQERIEQAKAQARVEMEALHNSKPSPPQPIETVVTSDVDRDVRALYGGTPDEV